MRNEDSTAGVGTYVRDEDLLAATRSDGRARVRVAPCADTVVVLGRGSRLEVECHAAACRDDGVPILRRRGGGCAVVLDPGNVVVSAVVTAPGLGNVRRLFDGFSRWVLDGLARAGVPGASRRDVCDLCLGDRKIGGAALYRAKDLVYYSTTLLVAPDVGLMQRYLPHPPREPDYRAGRAHAAFVTTLAARVGEPPAAFAARLNDVLGPPDSGARGGD